MRRGAADPTLVHAVRELVLWGARRRRRWRVRGSSMEPDFADGDLVLLAPAGAGRPVRRGDVAVARHPFRNLDVIKWVDSVDDDDHVRLRSPAGSDTGQFGRVPLATVRGTVTVNLTRLSRRTRAR